MVNKNMLKMDELNTTYCTEIENINNLDINKCTFNIKPAINNEQPGPIVQHLQFINKLLTEYLINDYSKESQMFTIILTEMNLLDLNTFGRIAFDIYSENKEIIKTILKKRSQKLNAIKTNDNIISQQHNLLNNIIEINDNILINDKKYFILSNNNIAQLASFLNINENELKSVLCDIINGKIKAKIIYKPKIPYLLNTSDKSENYNFIDPYTDNIDYFMESIN